MTAFEDHRKGFVGKKTGYIWVQKLNKLKISVIKLYGFKRSYAICVKYVKSSKHSKQVKLKKI